MSLSEVYCSIADADLPAVDLDPLGLALAADGSDGQAGHEGLAQEVRVLVLLGSLCSKLGTHGRMAMEACAEGLLLKPCLHGVLQVGFIQAKTGLMEWHHFGPKLLYGLLHSDGSAIPPT